MIINEGRPGKKLPALTNPGVAGDLLTGKQLIGADGQIITGTMASVVQATPSISVSASGLITASATQSAGRVTAGTKSATKQLTTQAGKTVTPGRTQQTAVASGRYTTGTVYVAGDSDLVAANIKKGVNIFGVAGTYEGESSYKLWQGPSGWTVTSSGNQITIEIDGITINNIYGGVFFLSGYADSDRFRNSPLLIAPYSTGGPPPVNAEIVDEGTSLWGVAEPFSGNKISYIDSSSVQFDQVEARDGDAYSNFLFYD